MATMRTKYAQCEFGAMAYWDNKLDNDAPALLFLHGISSSKSVYQKQMESSLLANRFRLVACDLPGHGESDWAESDKNAYTMLFYTKASLEFLEELACKKIILIGHNLAGHIIAEALSKLTAHTKIKAIIITGMAPIGRPTPMIADAFLPMEKEGPNHLPIFMNGPITKEQLEIWSHHVFAGSNLSTYQQSFISDVKKSDPKARVRFGQEWSSSRLSDEVKIFQKSNIPLLFIQGTEDSLINPQITSSFKLHNMWKDKIETIASCGHTPHLESSEEFNSLIAQFVVDIS
ncbi:MAG: hypothetical protein A2451_14925 [Bdellovibrionales bacterium RIFOXYC2_FULL_39_8]|nr:MAG: hypothetical protein A2451_14925 [Bdellovibrionales bacterium RIFOXYC2_FULL_39_8]